MAHSTELYPVEVDPFFVEDLRQMARAVKYQRWQFAMVAPFLTGRVLEVGGGIGNFTPRIAGIAQKVVSLEPNEYCFKQLHEKAGHLANVTLHRGTAESLDSILPPGEKFDAIVLMNVLEHIQDDRAVLAQLQKYLAPGGRLVVLVPAGQWAFGANDDRLGHYRRYDKRYARQLFAGLGLAVDCLRFYNFIGIWGWWWNAKIMRRHNQSDAQIRVFDNLFVPVLSRVENVLRPPLGQSLLIVGHNAQ
jgi:SAM-dependent methyltransferase